MRPVAAVTLVRRMGFIAAADAGALHRSRQELRPDISLSAVCGRSYAEGQYIAFVPWESLKPHLTPEGSKIFGGARPKSDDDDGTR